MLKCLVVIIAATLLDFCASPPPHYGVVRIMALGDSITAGMGEGGTDDGKAGYRGPLVDLLKSANYNFVMVGSRRDFSGRLDLPEHEGWPGYVLRSFPSMPTGQLHGAIIKHAINTYHPDIILLMAGTNDLVRYGRGAAGYTLPNIIESMNLVLGEIFDLDPKATVIVAGVIDTPQAPECAVLEFDDGVSSCGDLPISLPSLVKHYRSKGFRIFQAPGMDQAVPRSYDYFPDGIHPSGLDGYQRIAAVWYRAIEAVQP